MEETYKLPNYKNIIDICIETTDKSGLNTQNSSTHKILSYLLDINTKYNVWMINNVDCYDSVYLIFKAEKKYKINIDQISREDKQNIINLVFKTFILLYKEGNTIELKKYFNDDIRFILNASKTPKLEFENSICYTPENQDLLKKLGELIIENTGYAFNKTNLKRSFCKYAPYIHKDDQYMLFGKDICNALTTPEFSNKIKEGWESKYETYVNQSHTFLHLFKNNTGQTLYDIANHTIFNQGNQFHQTKPHIEINENTSETYIKNAIFQDYVITFNEYWINDIDIKNNFDKFLELLMIYIKKNTINEKQAKIITKNISKDIINEIPQLKKQLKVIKKNTI